MSRRRMINSDIWFSEKVASLPYPGRLLFIGMFSNADDDGLLPGSAKWLKAHIFPYDDISLDDIGEYKRTCHELGIIKCYSVDNNEYIWLPGWLNEQRIQKDRFRRSEYPQPDGFVPRYPMENEPIKNTNTQGVQNVSNLDTKRVPSLVKSSLSQSSQVEDNIVKSNTIPNFSLLNNSGELTDVMMTTLKSCASAGNDSPAYICEVYKKVWRDRLGSEMPVKVFSGLFACVKKYPSEILAPAFARGISYNGGKHQSWNYFQKIIDEELENK